MLGRALTLAALAMALTWLAMRPSVPVAPRKVHRTTVHGIEVASPPPPICASQPQRSDPYHYLRYQSDADTLAYIAAENVYTDGGQAFPSRRYNAFSPDRAFT